LFGEISPRDELVQMLLTDTVPYAVSTASSIGAMRDYARRVGHVSGAIGAREE
jgi:hypothetical protein